MLYDQGKAMPKKGVTRSSTSGGPGTPKETAAGSSSSSGRVVEKVEKVAPLKIRLSTRKKRRNDDSDEGSGFQREFTSEKQIPIFSFKKFF